MTQQDHSIDALLRGEIAVITGIDRDGRDPIAAQRLHEMGFDVGVDLVVLHRAPFGGDPLSVQIGNMTVALRKSLAALIEIHRMDAPQPA